MSVFSHIAGLCRTIESGYPTAIADLARDGELLRDYRTAPAGSARRQHLSDVQHSYRGSRKIVDDYRRELAELGQLIFQHLPDVAVRLRIVSPVTGTMRSDPDLDGLVGELRLIQAAAIRAAAGDTSPAEPVVEPDQGRDQDKPISPALAKWIRDLPPDDTPGLRPAYRRDRLWLRWHHEKPGFGPAKIRDRWNAMPKQEQEVVSPRCFGIPVSAAVVKEGLKKARSEEPSERRSRTSRKPAGNRRSRRKL